jgi:hypothetical protein
MLIGPSFCTTANEKVYITAIGCETEFGGTRGLQAADAGAVLIRQNHVVCTDGNEAGVTDFHLVVKLDQALGLSPILRAVSSPAEHQDRGICSL